MDANWVSAARRPDCCSRFAAATYRPNKWWLAAAIVGWLVTVPANLRPSTSTSYLVGEVCGLLILPFGIRLVWVALAGRGPRPWERALFSPWAWTIGIVLDIMSAAGRSHS